VDGVLYHHILDTATGYPYDNGLLGVTIITKASVDGDGLSTTCFALGLTDGMALIESLPDTEAVFITEDYELHTSSGIGTKIPFQELE
jgi:thiamine biosynthesis lipoprotein